MTIRTEKLRRRTEQVQRPWGRKQLAGRRGGPAGTTSIGIIWLRLSLAAS